MGNRAGRLRARRAADLGKQIADHYQDVVGRIRPDPEQNALAAARSLTGELVRHCLPLAEAWPLAILAHRDGEDSKLISIDSLGVVQPG